MIQSLYTASSGMLAQQMSMDNTANNIANVNTSGYKKSRVEFQDLIYSKMRDAGRMTVSGQTLQNGIQVGNGARVANNHVLFEQGDLQQTGNSTDLALAGNAFFEIILPNGTKAYTRDGSFKIDGDGYMVTGNGQLSNMDVRGGGLLTFPADATKININDSGFVYQDRPVANMETFGFTSAKDLSQVEPGIFVPTDASGEPTLLAELKEALAEELTDEEGNPLPPAKQPELKAFYQVLLPSGETGYTDVTSFKMDETGKLITADQGYPVEPEVTVDLEAFPGLGTGTVLEVDDGVITQSVEAGKMNIMQFTNPSGLQKIGDNLYVPTVNSGAAEAATDFKMAQGTLEMSNVQVAEEMVNMMIAQRAYEMSSRSIKTSDEMLGLANSLLRR